MKNFTLLIAIIFISITTSAQSNYRLMAHTFYNNNGSSFVPVDSSLYYYNNPQVQNNYSKSTEYDYISGVYDSDEVFLQSFNSKGLVDSLWGMDWSSYHHNYINYYVMANYYDANNNDTSQVEGLWDTIGNNYSNWERYTYAYDNKGNLLVYTSYGWNNNMWVPALQQTHIYNQYNKQIATTTATWSGTEWDTASYGSYYKEAYDYNSKNEDTLVVGLSFNFNTRTFDTVNRLMLTFNKNGYDSIEINQSWNVTPPTWQNVNLYQYGYNAGGYLTTSYSQNWSSNNWVKNEQSLSGYNGANLLTSEVNTYWNGSAYVPTSGASEQFWYFETYTGIDQLSLKDTYFTVYPNPCTNSVQTNIVFTKPTYVQLRLLNILGQQVWSADLGNVQQYKGAIPVSNLPTGVYMLQLVTNIGAEAQQVVVGK